LRQNRGYTLWESQQRGSGEFLKKSLIFVAKGSFDGDYKRLRRQLLLSKRFIRRGFGVSKDH